MSKQGNNSEDPFTEGFETLYLPRSLIWCSWVEFYDLGLQTNVFLAKSSLFNQDLVWWLCCDTFVARHNPYVMWKTMVQHVFAILPL